ncbi:MAG: radical SAM family heme chaperone HemW [Bacilli bacterium]|nr:radical SAM family heme chaperone HemW [Bacilli bacterium]
MHSVYIHIPFCSHICSYCDFTKLLHLEPFVDDYLENLQQEILDNYDGERLKTLYIGGGTPSCLTRKERIKLFQILEIFIKDSDCEYTIECNPRDITEEFLDDIVAAGVNRISIGVESFDEENLKILERKADFKDLEKKIELIKNRGIDNINIDLMYALPNESLKVLKEDLKKFIKLKVAHISTYSLMIEDHTKLGNSKIDYVPTELDAKMFDTICAKLKKNGFIHYEVSNFALPGFESKHNLNYWDNGEYYGFGLGASGFKAGFRYTNTRNLREYNEGNYRKENELMSYKDMMDNELMLGFRKLKGINVDEFYEKYGENIQDVFPKINDYLKSGDLIYKKGYLSIPEDKIYVMNEILVNIL